MKIKDFCLFKEKDFFDFKKKWIEEANHKIAKAYPHAPNSDICKLDFPEVNFNNSYFSHFSPCLTEDGYFYELDYLIPVGESEKTWLNFYTEENNKCPGLVCSVYYADFNASKYYLKLTITGIDLTMSCVSQEIIELIESATKEIQKNLNIIYRELAPVQQQYNLYLRNFDCDKKKILEVSREIKTANLSYPTV